MKFVGQRGGVKQHDRIPDPRSPSQGHAGGVGFESSCGDMPDLISTQVFVFIEEGPIRGKKVQGISAYLA